MLGSIIAKNFHNFLLTPPSQRFMGFSNYEAAIKLFKAGRPILVQRLRLTCAASYNDFFFNVNHPEVFTYMYKLNCISQKNKLYYYTRIFGQHVSTPIESSSGPSRIRSNIKV